MQANCSYSSKKATAKLLAHLCTKQIHFYRLLQSNLCENTKKTNTRRTPKSIIRLILNTQHHYKNQFQTWSGNHHKL
uniref:Uncharacterized protein n=1 Tax=Anguilla anguilla TaxID=7936 RepID=A0A0E9XC65_ANGAN